MPNIVKNPYDNVDLSLLIESFDESIGTLYPVAIVYGPDGALLAGSPFTLASVGNNLYVLRNAFQADVSSGTYMVIYEVYTDAAHTIKSPNFGQKHDTISIQIQASSGLGVAGGDIYFDDSKIIKMFDEKFKLLSEKFDALQKDFDNGIRVELPKNEESKNKNSEIIDLINIYHKSNKSKFEDILDGIRKNRNITIKSKFDKRVITPIFSEIVNSNINMLKEIKQTKKDLTSIIDLKNAKLDELNSKNLEKAMLPLYEVIDNFNESLRTKMLYMLKMFKVYTNSKVSHNIKLTMKKDE